MTLQARPVEQDHLRTLFRLKVTPDQQKQVAPNEYTLAQQAYEPGSGVWGLWDDDDAVGLMAMINPSESNDEDLDAHPNAAYIWRLMIDHRFQGKGYGTQAIARAGDVAKQWGLTHLTLSFVDRPGGAEGFYTKCGFTRTGRIIDDEVEMIAAI